MMPNTYQTKVWRLTGSQYNQEWFDRNVEKWLDEKVEDGYVLHSISETTQSGTSGFIVRATVELKHLRYR